MWHQGSQWPQQPGRGCLPCLGGSWQHRNRPGSSAWAGKCCRSLPGAREVCKIKAVQNDEACVSVKERQQVKKRSQTLTPLPKPLNIKQKISLMSTFLKSRSNKNKKPFLQQIGVIQCGEKRLGRSG